MVLITTHYKMLTSRRAMFGGKAAQKKFPTDGGKPSDEPLELVHSDVREKMNAKSLSEVNTF